MHRNGKLNPASSCGFFAGYGVTPDGTINGYRVMNLRTHRFTTKFNVRFNVQLPALRYVLSAIINSPQRLLIGRKIRKRFDQGTFTGTITSSSTVDNTTFYQIKYTDGDEEQMDILDVLKHIVPAQEDLPIPRPAMHKRLRQSTKYDRARLGKDLLPTSPLLPPHPTVAQPAACAMQPDSTCLLRRSAGNKRPLTRLTSTSTGTTSNSPSTPLPLRTHTTNRANVAKARAARPLSRWRMRHTDRAVVLPMLTLIVNAVTTVACPPPNAVVNGIRLHRYSTVFPPIPRIPSRDVPLPTGYDDAVHGPFAPFWRPAIQREIDSLLRYNVWSIEPLPRGALVLPCKFVFKVKPNGEDPPGIDKFKSRYCGKGFYQKLGVHYLCAHAPVAFAVTTRLIVAIATELGWPLHGMDVRNAYLNAPLDPSVVLFVRPPPTIHVPPGYGLRLNKGLYGTMQGGNRWAIHKHLKLVALGLTRNPSEPSLYHRHDARGIVLMSIIVDDFQITGWPAEAVTYMKHQLSETWDMTDLGPLRYFASVEIKRTRDARTTTLKQTGHIEDILARYGLSDAYTKPTPCTASIYNQRLLDPVSDYAPTFNNDYRSQVGSLGYLRRTRPDLCVSLGVVSQFVKLGRHGPPHYRALRNIMRYCSLTKHHGLLYTSTHKGFRDPWDLSGHVDSDWAS